MRRGAFAPIGLDISLSFSALASPSTYEGPITYTRTVAVRRTPPTLSARTFATVALVAAVLAALIAYEALRFAEARDRIRHQLVEEPVAD